MDKYFETQKEYARQNALAKLHKGYNMNYPLKGLGNYYEMKKFEEVFELFKDIFGRNKTEKDMFDNYFDYVEKEVLPLYDRGEKI